MLANTRKIIVVVGPTCTGKSQLSMDLALAFNGEIVNADSMQVYKHFNIGTAKQDDESRRIIPHHLIDVAEPYEDFNAAIFKDMAGNSISDIWSRCRIPIIVGGTGLYVRALMYDLFKVRGDKTLRENLNALYDDDPLGFYENMKKVDPEYSLKVSFRDKRRMVRAMEVFQLTGFSMSEWSRKHGFKSPRYEALKIGLQKPRDELFKRINERVDTMLASGWIEEVKGIFSLGFDEHLKPFSSIGYREIVLYLHGSITYEDMVKDIKKFTRHYAKRQFTWFLREKDISWYEYPEGTDTMKQKVIDFLT
jgi:tRNA dimethylallyltransferase